MEMITNAINWFEIPVADFNRAKKFYSTIYDFDMPEMEMDGAKMGILLHDQEKGIGGAIIKTEGMEPSARGIRVYLNGGSDLSTVLSRVEGAGGKIVMPKTLIGDGMGHYAVFEDTEGNQIGIHSNA